MRRERSSRGAVLRFASGALAVLVVGGVMGGCASQSATSPSAHHHQVQIAGADETSTGLVGYPVFLPKSTLHYHSDTEVVGTAARPALTSQGDPVKVVAPHWSLVAVVTGPEVPGEGSPYQAPATTCTWTVTLSRATAPVPISVFDFDTIDDVGEVFRPYLVPGQPVPQVSSIRARR